MNAIHRYALTAEQQASLAARGLMNKPVPHLQPPAIVPKKKYQAKRPIICLGVYASHGWKWNEDFGGLACWRCGQTKPKRKARYGIKLCPQITQICADA